METGAKKYRYIRTGSDDFFLAFTYAWMAAMEDAGYWAWIKSLDELRERFLRDNPAFEARFYERGGFAAPVALTPRTFGQYTAVATIDRRTP